MIFFLETLSEFCVGVFAYEVFLDHLEALTEEKIWISGESSYAVFERVDEVTMVTVLTIKRHAVKKIYSVLDMYSIIDKSYTWTCWYTNTCIKYC